MKKIPLTFSALALALTLGVASSAQAVLMSDLINGQSITAGDKVFDRWGVIYQASSDGHQVNTSNIDVIALNDGGMNPGPGLTFNILNNEFSVTGDGLYAFLDFSFGFHVSTVGSMQINGNSLDLGLSVLSTNSDLGFQDLGLFIKEDVGTTPGANNLGMLNVEFSNLFGATTFAGSDVANFIPQDDIFVTKNILLWAMDTSETVSTTGFTQRFSQTVPEPGTLLLFVPAMAALVGMRRKSKSS